MPSWRENSARLTKRVRPCMRMSIERRVFLAAVHRMRRATRVMMRMPPMSRPTKCGASQITGRSVMRAPVFEPFDPHHALDARLRTPPQDAVLEQAARESAESARAQAVAALRVVQARENTAANWSARRRAARAQAHTAHRRAPLPTRASSGSGRKCSNQISARPSSDHRRAAGGTLQRVCTVCQCSRANFILL